MASPSNDCTLWLRLIVLSCIVLSWDVPALGKTPSDGSRGGPPDEPEDLTPVIEPIRKKHDLPALAAAVLLDDRLMGTGAVGVRKYGTDIPVQLEDSFHLASCTKAMTATLIARLIEQGELRWETTVADTFPELFGTMHVSYANVTVLQLLSHRSGLPPPERSLPAGDSALEIYRLPSPQEQRRKYVELMLRQPPDAEPGTKVIYSNAGYVIAGAIAERVTRASWEELMRQMIFRPLGMQTAGFGVIGSPGEIRQPWQHRLEGSKRVPVEPVPESDNPAVLGPAATVFCSVGDWAKFVQSHLSGIRGDRSLMSPRMFRKLHTPAFPGDYALGWITAEREWGEGRVLTHSGSTDHHFCVVWLGPLKNFAVLVATNQGGEQAAQGCDEVAITLVLKFLVSRQNR